MSGPIPTATRRQVLTGRHTPEELCRRLRTPGANLFLDGRGGFAEGWTSGSLVAFDPQVRLLWEPSGSTTPNEALARLEARVAARRRSPDAGPETGVALLAGYDLFSAGAGGRPRLLALEVDRSVAICRAGGVRVTTRSAPTMLDQVHDAFLARLSDSPAGGERPPARVVGGVRTSLPREAYLRSVRRIRRHISRGDIYQANLSQRFDGEYRGDALECYLKLSAQQAAPHAAFVEAGEVALLSVSPETFLRSNRAGEIETWPIKGTRPRGDTADRDRAAAQALVASEKDRAELLMIVDLERNDLSRVSIPGSVRVSELAALRSYPAVHHLVAGIHARLLPEVGLAAILRAAFPGGSITGAPKLRAMDILSSVEPVRRGYFTGSLFWFSDDGKLDSSILIRTLIFRSGRFCLGAGGGVVTDSEPQAEWLESNHKARALAQVLGFDPAEAT